MKGIDKERGKHSPEGGSRWSSPSFVETTVAASPTSSSSSMWVTQQTVVVVVVDVGDAASCCSSLSLGLRTVPIATGSTGGFYG